MALFRLFLLVLWSTTLESFYLRNISTHSSETDYMKALHQIIPVIDKLVSFFEEEIYEVNLDAILGLRVLEGSLAVCLTQHGDSFWNATLTTKYIHQKLSQLRSQAGSISNRSQASLKEQAKEYYFTFKELVDRPWSYFKDFGKRTLPLSRVKVLKVGEDKKNGAEETCLSEALGSHANHTECMFTQICVKWITNQKTAGYGATHQILFLTFAKMHNCEAKYSKILKEHLGIDVDGLIENRCVKIMGEMLWLEKKNVPKGGRDLYMEQGVVCSIQGYEEFLSLERLMRILSLQRTPGCFGKNKNHEGENDDEEQRGTFGDEEDEGQKGTLWDKVKDNIEQGGTHKIHKRQRAQKHVGSFMSMRRLLEDMTVGHGCSAHESGVAAGLLGIYTKWLLTKIAPGSETPIKSSNLTELTKTQETNRVPTSELHI